MTLQSFKNGPPPLHPRSCQAHARKPRKRWPKGGPRQWSPASVTAFEDALLCLGEDRAEEAMQRIGATHCVDLGPEAAPALASFVRLLADTVASTPSPPRPELPSDTLQRHLNMDCPPVAALCPQEVLEAGDGAVDAWLRDFTSEKVEAATAWARREFEARVPEFWAEHVMGRIAEQVPPRLAKVRGRPRAGRGGACKRPVAGCPGSPAPMMHGVGSPRSVLHPDRHWPGGRTHPHMPALAPCRRWYRSRSTSRAGRCEALPLPTA